MSFALVSAQIYGVEAEEAVNERYKQVAILQITAANTDTALDTGNFAGTFWTAVSGSDPGKSALLAFKDIQNRAISFYKAGSDALAGLIQATAASATAYVLAMDGTNKHLPSITFNSGTAPTAYYIIYEWVLAPGQEPVEFAG